MTNCSVHSKLKILSRKIKGDQNFNFEALLFFIIQYLMFLTLENESSLKA